MKQWDYNKLVEYSVLSIILLLYLLLGVMFASRTPDWQVPDEPAHYNYIRQIADRGELPVIQMGDWDQQYQNLLTQYAFYPILTGEVEPAAWNDPVWREKLSRVNRTPHDYAVDVIDTGVEQDISRIQYEDHQPPLYYLIQTPVYLLTDGDLTLMRIFSLFIGSGVIICAWLVIRMLFPAMPWMALSGAAFVAFIPQRLSIMAGVSNDSLAELMAGVVFVLVTMYLTRPAESAQKYPYHLPVLMGVAVGLVFLTKTTVYYTAGIAGLVIALRAWRDGLSRELFFRQAVAYLIPALLLGSIWWIHSVNTYGDTDFLGLQRHDEVVVGQLRTEDYIERDLGGDTAAYRDNLAETTFHSFWAQFGWMSTPLPNPRHYQVLLLAVIVILAGAVIHMTAPGWFDAPGYSRWHMLALMLLAIFLVFLQFLIYNLSFVQFQGRYLYPALIPMAVFVGMGLDGWAQSPFVLGIHERLSRPLRWLPVLIAFCMVFFVWYTLQDVVSTLPSWQE